MQTFLKLLAPLAPLLEQYQHATIRLVLYQSFISLQCSKFCLYLTNVLDHYTIKMEAIFQLFKVTRNLKF